MIASGTTISCTDKAAWLAERRKGVGASEAAAVCGVSDYDTPLSVYLRKVGLAPEKGESTAMRLGTRLEPVVAQEYADAFGCEFSAEQRFVRSPVHPFMFATIDRVRADGKLVELKTIGFRAAASLGDQLGESGSDVVPFAWRMQVLHQMCCTGTDSVDIAALVGGQDVRFFTVPFDERVAARMVEMEAEFWGRVERREPPEVDPSRDARALALLYPAAEGEVELPFESGLWADEMERARAEANRLTKVADSCKANLLAEMQGAASGKLADGRIVTRKVVNRDGYTVAPSFYVDLRVKTPKGAK